RLDELPHRFSLDQIHLPMRYGAHGELTGRRDPGACGARIFHDTGENQWITMPADLDDVLTRIRLRCAKHGNDNFIDLFSRFVHPGPDSGHSMLEMGIRGM